MDPSQGHPVGPGMMQLNSFWLLMELMSSEPTILSCLRIIQSTCLAQGFECRIKGARASKRFSEFLEKYYIPFCENAIRAMFTCGFVPWRLRRLHTGDAVPEVLPLGTFNWRIEPHTSKMTRGLNESGGNKKRLPNGNQATGSLYKHANEKHAWETISKEKGVTDNSDQKDKGKGTAKKAENDKAVDGGTAEPADPPSLRDGSITKPAKKEPLDPIFLRQQAQLRSAGRVPDDETSKGLRYKINLLESIGVEEDQVEIYEFIQPTNNITNKSQLFQVVHSPMAHAVVDYLVLRQTQLRLAHADAWNTQAKLVCSYAEPSNIYNVNEGFPITSDWIQPQNRMGLTSDANIPAEMESNVHMRDAVAEAVIGAKLTEHSPLIYSLPKNSKLEQMQRLESCQDIEHLQQRLAKSISSIMGVPYEIIGGGYSSQTAGQKSLENSRLFTTNMMEICRHLQNILVQVYVASYGGTQAEVSFSLRPTPRIVIESIQDLSFLIENGLVSTDNAYDLSNMLLGVDLRQGAGKSANAGEGSPFQTPGNALQNKLADSTIKSNDASIKGQDADVRKTEADVKKTEADVQKTEADVLKTKAEAKQIEKGPPDGPASKRPKK